MTLIQITRAALAAAANAAVVSIALALSSSVTFGLQASTSDRSESPALGCPSAIPGSNAESTPCGPLGDNITSVAAAPHGGFWVQTDTRTPTNLSGKGSRTVVVDGATQFDNIDVPGRIAAIPNGNGYFVVTQDGKIFARGDAPTLCRGDLSNCGDYKAAKQGAIVAIAVTHDGKGLWAATENGGVYTAGNAVYHGDHRKESHPCTGIVALPSGEGYYLLFSDGGIYAVNAPFHGSTGGKSGHIVAMTQSLDLSGNLTGYWMIGANGGVLSFDAPFLGSTGGNDNGHSVTDITTLPNGHEYAWVNDQGQVTVSASQTLQNVTLTSVPDHVLITSPSTVNAAPLVLAPDDTAGSLMQLWTIEPVSSGGQVVRFANQSTGYCMNINQQSDNLVIQFPCQKTPTLNETFRMYLQDGQDGVWTIAPESSPDLYVGLADNGQLRLDSLANGGQGTKWILQQPKNVAAATQPSQETPLADAAQ